MGGEWPCQKFSLPEVPFWKIENRMHHKFWSLQWIETYLDGPRAEGEVSIFMLLVGELWLQSWNLNFGWTAFMTGELSVRDEYQQSVVGDQSMLFL